MEEVRVHFRAPTELSVSPAGPEHVLVLGECVGAWLGDAAMSIGCSIDFLLINNFALLPESPPSRVADYDFQIIQIPLRSILPEWEYLELPFGDENAWLQLLETSCQRLTERFEDAMRYNTESGLLSFVAGFLVPQQNPMGKLLPRDDPRNLVFIVEALNRHLVNLVASPQNAYYLDLDQIASGIGKQSIQDDLVNASTHGAYLSSFDYARDRDRIEALEPLDRYFDIQVNLFRKAVWAELRSMYRTVRQADQVKMVIVDLDDTLWRGIISEESDRSDDTIEGWPMGMIEALQFLKKRGVLLGIISKNDQASIEAMWDHIFRGRLRLDDFVVRKINWRAKAENLEEILAEVNLLSRSVVYVDDNPVERASITAAFPDIRVLGAQLYHLKRVLMWSAETQVPFVSDESDRRTEMVKRQVARERERRRIPREEFPESTGHTGPPVRSNTGRPSQDHTSR